jgi:outer membrane protein OmpA-like peptidoglycan-associated protein
MKTATFMVCSLPLLLHTLPASAGEVSKEAISKDDIVCALDPKCAKPPSRSFNRGITTTGDTTKDASLSVNLYVNFAYDSAKLTADTRIILDRLGVALRDDRLNGFSFMIAGHTDAKGSVEYNQTLSERRAEAVREYMISQYGIKAERLAAVGYGKSKLLDPDRPEDGVNRRVQILNVTAARQR